MISTGHLIAWLKEKLASHCHRHLEAAPSIEHMTARTRALERGRTALRAHPGNRGFSCEQLVGILYITFILLVCTILSARIATTEQPVSIFVGRVATLEGHLIPTSNAIQDAGVRVHQTEARARPAETAEQAAGGPRTCSTAMGRPQAAGETSNLQCDSHGLEGYGGSRSQQTLGL